MHLFYIIMSYAGTTINTCISKKVNDISQIHLEQGDFLEITNDGFCVDGAGWFIRVVVNQKRHFYISYDDLEKCLYNKEMVSIADLQFKLTFWNAQLNQALEQRNEEWFKFVSRKILSLQKLYEAMESNAA